jgi:ABC-type bacteriocin/lantibiotic exporter with double-glycine peptidase domain
MYSAPGPADTSLSPTESSKHLASPPMNPQNASPQRTNPENPRSSGSGRGHGARTVTAEEKAQAREVSLRRIGQLFKPYTWQLTIVTAIIVASSIVGVASPFLLRAVIDTALPDRNLRLLIPPSPPPSA